MGDGGADGLTGKAGEAVSSLREDVLSRAVAVELGGSLWPSAWGLACSAAGETGSPLRSCHIYGRAPEPSALAGRPVFLQAF